MQTLMNIPAGPKAPPSAANYRGRDATRDPMRDASESRFGATLRSATTPAETPREPDARPAPGASASPAEPPAGVADKDAATPAEAIESQAAPSGETAEIEADAGVEEEEVTADVVVNDADPLLAAEVAGAAVAVPPPPGDEAVDVPVINAAAAKPAAPADAASTGDAMPPEAVPKETKTGPAMKNVDVDAATAATPPRQGLESDAAAGDEQAGPAAPEAGDAKPHKQAATAMEPARLAPQDLAAAGKLEANKAATVAPAGDAPADDSGVRAMSPMQAGTTANAPPTSVGATPDSPRPLVEQGVDATVTAAKTMTAGGRQQQTMTLRLDPPQLGSMRVNVQMTDGQLTATFSAGSEVAHRLLQQNLPQLKAGLEQAGFNVDRLNVQRTPPAQGPQDGQFHQQQNQDGQPREQMQQHQRDQQRRETLIRIWRRGGFDGDRTNLVA